MCHFYRADTLVAPLFGGFAFEKTAKTSKIASISLIFQIYFYVVIDFLLSLQPLIIKCLRNGLC